MKKIIVTFLIIPLAIQNIATAQNDSGVVIVEDEGEIISDLAATSEAKFIFDSTNSYLKNWYVNQLPTLKKTLQQYNWNGVRNEVYWNENQVMVRWHSYTDLKGDIPPFEITKDSISNFHFAIGARTLKKVDDGYLIGFNAGEWGGSLWWFDNEGKRRYKLTYCNFKNFVEIDGKLLGITGLAHLSSSTGRIIEIYKEDSIWKSKKFCDLPSSPYTFALDDDLSLIIATSTSLVRVNLNARLDTLIGDPNWRYYLSPNSMVIDSNSIYIGMSGGVMRIYKDDFTKSEWLTPEE